MTRDQVKASLRDHMASVERSVSSSTDLLANPEYRTAAALLAIMEKQDPEVSPRAKSKS